MASITCGNCKGTHGSVGEVRNCYKGMTMSKDDLRSPYETKGVPRQSTTQWAKDNMKSFGANHGTTAVRLAAPTATSKQAWLIVDLLLQRSHLKGESPDWNRDEMAAQQMEQTRTEASEAIQRLISEIEQLKAERKAPKNHARVPAGRYAIERDGTLRFYVVSIPDEGRWAGYTFVDVQASAERYPIKNMAVRQSILNQIREDVQGAMERYGRELGHCGHCGRALTNEESRARGIGPICAGRMGW